MAPKPTAAEQLAAMLDEPESNGAAVVRKARAVHDWVLAIADGGDYTDADAEALGKAYDALIGAQSVRRARALHIVTEWLPRRLKGMKRLAKQLGEVDLELHGIARALQAAPGDLEEVRGTAKRRGGPWTAPRVLALMCFRTGALGFPKLDGKASIDPTTLDKAADQIALAGTPTSKKLARAVAKRMDRKTPERRRK